MSRIACAACVRVAHAREQKKERAFAALRMTRFCEDVEVELVGAEAEGNVNYGFAIDRFAGPSGGAEDPARKRIH